MALSALPLSRCYQELADFLLGVLGARPFPRQWILGKALIDSKPRGHLSDLALLWQYRIARIVPGFLLWPLGRILTRLPRLVLGRDFGRAR